MYYQTLGLLFIFIYITLFNIVSILYIIIYVKHDRGALLLSVLWCILTYILYGMILFYAAVE